MIARTSFYVIAPDPAETYGPFFTEEEANNCAKEIDGDGDQLMWVLIRNTGDMTIGRYTDEFFKGE